MASKCSSAHLSFLTLGALEYQLIGVLVAVCFESVADSIVGGESTGGTFKGLLASLTEQHPTPVDPADRGQAVVMGVLGTLSGSGTRGGGACRRQPPGPFLSLGCWTQVDDSKQADSRRTTCLRVGLLCGEVSVDQPCY